MKPLRFTTTVLGLLALLGIAYAAAFRVAVRQPVWPFHWLRNVYVVKEQLAAESKAPRCLILGGSSVMFGFQSGLIEEATGLHVVNLGLHAEIPLEFQLWQAARHLRRGDSVLLAAELGYYWPGEHRYTTFAATEIALMAPEFWGGASWRSRYEMITTIPPSHVAAGLASRIARDRAAYAGTLALPPAGALMENLRARWAGTSSVKLPSHYNYLELDRHGDYVRFRATAAHGHEDYGLNTPHAVDAATWRLLSDFAQQMSGRGVRCLVAWPPFERHAGLDLNAAPPRDNFALLRAQFARAHWLVVGEPEDAAFAPEFFYDTPYHLTTDGARQRTERLVARWRVAVPGGR